jgi:surfeit locus 1 family protein
LKILGFRPALGPTLFTIPALILLLALGTWQVQRLLWKLDLIASVEEGMKAAPIMLPAGPLDADVWHFRRVKVQGRFDHAREFHLLAHSERGNFGYHVITPLKRSDAPGWVLVSRGWVPAEDKEPARRMQGQVDGEVTITGVAHAPWGKGWFTPDNDLQRNLWYYGDAAGMLAAAGIKDAPVLFVDADDSVTVPGGWPRSGHTRLTFTNNHLAYAFTWYSGAVVLAVIYVLWHRRRARDAAQDRDRPAGKP